MQRRWTSRMRLGVVGVLLLCATVLAGCTCWYPPHPPNPPNPPNPPGPTPQQCTPYKRGFVLPIEKKPSDIRHVAWSPDGKLFVTVNALGEMLVRTHYPGIVEERYKAPLRTKIASVAFAADGSALLSVGDDGAVRVWRDGKEQRSFLPPKAGLIGTSIASGMSNGASFFAAGFAAKDGTGFVTFRSLDLNNSTVAARIPLGEAVASIAIRPDGLAVAIGMANGVIDIRDTITGQRIRLVEPTEKSTAPISVLAWSHDGGLIAAAQGKRFTFVAVPKLVSDPNGARVLSLTAHKHDITSFGFSPDGKFFVAVSASPTDASKGEFKVWSLAQIAAKKLVELASPSTMIQTDFWAVAWQPDAKLSTLVFGASRGTSQVWVVDALPTYLGTYSIKRPLSSIDFNRDDRAIAHGSTDGNLGVFFLSDLRHTTRDLKSPIVRVGWDLDTSRVIALTKDGRIHSFDWEKDELVSSQSFGREGTTMSLRRDGKASAVGFADGSVALLPPAPYQKPPLFVRNVHKGGVTNVEWSFSGELLATTGKDGAVKIWRYNTTTRAPQLLRTFRAPAGQHPTRLRFNRNDETLAVGMTGGYIGLWRQFPDAWKLHKTDHPTTVIEWQNLGNSLLMTAGTKAGSVDFNVHMWKVEDPSSLTHLHTIDEPKHSHTSPITALSSSWNDQSVLSGSGDGTWRLWKIRRAYGILTLSDASNPLRLLSQPNGAQLYMGTTNTFLHQFKLNATPKPTLRLTPAHDQSIPHMALSASGKELLTASLDGRLHTWDLTGQEPKKVRTYPDDKSTHKHGTAIYGMGFNHNQTILAAGGYEPDPDVNKGQITFWKVGNSTKPMHVISNIVRVKSMVWHPTKDILLTGHERPGIRVWERKGDTYVLARTIDIYHPLSTGSLSIETTKGDLVASSSRYGDIRIWSLSTGKQIQRLDTGGASASNMIFHPNGKSIAVSMSNGQVKIWQISDGKLLHRLVDSSIQKPGSPYLAHDGSVSAMSWSKTENVIFTGGSDLTIKQWKCAK